MASSDSFALQKFDPTPLLNPQDLYDKRRSKDAARLKAYNKILEQIYNRVRSISKLPNSQCYVLYIVPPFILGLPKIDLEDCVVYLIYQLRHAQYDVRYTPPNMLYISWAHHEKSYIMSQSPIMGAMLESAERTQAEMAMKEKEASRLLSQRKSGKKVQIQTPGFATKPILKNPYDPTPYQSNPNPTAGPPIASAADYVPSSSFVERMLNPNTNVAKPTAVRDYFS
jgi:hypothetical protein